MGSYVRLLKVPGAAYLAFWGMIGRFPIAMRALSILMLISAVTGSLGDAGIVAAAMLVSQGVASPVLGRMADRISQRRILLAACPAHLVGMTFLLVSILLRAPLWLVIVGAVTAGCASVSFSSFMRVRWAVMVDRTQLRTAYALESMLDEMIFLVGPLLVTVLALWVNPAAGLIVCGLLTLTGSVFVALHHRSEPAQMGKPGHAHQWSSPMPGVWVLAIANAGMCFLFGALDVTMIAFAVEQGTPGLSGVLIALIALGSLISGVAYGAVNWRLSEVQLLNVTTLALTVCALPLAFARSSLLMAVFAAFAGIAISPALISASTLLESVAAKGALSEAFGWMASAGALGIAAGTAVGGHLVDLGDFSYAAWAGVAGGAVALFLSLVGRPALKVKKTSSETASELMALEYRQ
ncbi:MFS transporter [Streptomyces sp. NPDC055709]